MHGWKLGVLQVRTPMLVSSRPEWMAFSKDVLSRKWLFFPPTLGCDRCVSSVIGVRAEEPSVVLLPCHRALADINSLADAAEGFEECFQPFVLPSA